MKNKKDPYFSGEKLYGDDFTEKQIIEWYKKEENGYANKFGISLEDEEYEFRGITNMYAYNHISEIKYFGNVLGFGSSWGYEFYDIADKIKRLIIVDPSSKTCSSSIKSIKPEYVKPSHTGMIAFDDNQFDLIVCFGTLHHIPNVTCVMQELYRVLKPDGIICLREPIKSMGDWNHPRLLATACERGIPVKLFDKMIADLDYEVMNRSFCYTCRGVFQRIFGQKFARSKIYNFIDKYLSSILKGNICYHPTTFSEKLCPSMIFYVLKKRSIITL